VLSHDTGAISRPRTWAVCTQRAASPLGATAARHGHYDSRQQRDDTAYGHASPGTEVVREHPDDRGDDGGTADEGQHVQAHDATAQLGIDGELDGGVGPETRG
jgi:hypothetical protein